MIVLWICLGVFLGVILYLLFAPFRLEVDSDLMMLRVRFHRLASARIYCGHGTLMLDFQIGWWKKTMDLLQPAKKSEARSSARENKAKSSGKRRTMPLRKVMAVMRSFKLKRCIIHIDTGNMEWNGILFPVAYWLRMKSGQDILIRFDGMTRVALTIENNAARMIRAYVMT
jgi:hypothetical protein